MGVFCKFSNYNENHDVLGAVKIYKYLQKLGRIPAKRNIKQVKTKSLEEFIKPEFLGTGFDVLQKVMNFYKVPFELFHDEKIISRNTIDGHKLQLVTSDKTKCSKLMFVLSPLDIYKIPRELKKPKGAIDDEKSYVTTLGEVLGADISPDPLDAGEIKYDELEEKYSFNFEIWTKTKQKADDHYKFISLYKSSRYDVTYRFHMVSEWQKLIYIRDENKYFQTFYKCPNHHFRCFYKTSQKSDIDKHVAICKDPKILRETPVCTQKEFGPKLHPINDLIKLGVINEEPKMNSFVLYDIESICTKENYQVIINI